MLQDSGFTDVVIGDPVDTFGGAKGQDKARAFDVYGYAFMARRPVPNDPRWRRLLPDTAAIRRFPAVAAPARQRRTILHECRVHAVQAT